MPIAIPEVKQSDKKEKKNFSTPPKQTKGKKAKTAKPIPVAKKVLLNDQEKTEPVIKETIPVETQNNGIEEFVKIEQHVAPPWGNAPVVQEQKPKALNFQDVLKSVQQVQPVIPSFMKR